MNKYVLPVSGDPDAPPFEIVCNTMEAALAQIERLGEANLTGFERPAYANTEPGRYAATLHQASG
jgi:hypothetical protein